MISPREFWKGRLLLLLVVATGGPHLIPNLASATDLARGHLTFEEIQAYINPQSCKGSADGLVGCLLGLNAILEAAETPTETPTEISLRLDVVEGPGTATVAFDKVLKAVAVEKQNFNSIDLYIQAKNREKKEFYSRAFQSHYDHSMRDLYYSFERAIEWTKKIWKQKIQPHEKTQVGLMAINLFIQFESGGRNFVSFPEDSGELRSAKYLASGSEDAANAGDHLRFSFRKISSTSTDQTVLYIRLAIFLSDQVAGIGLCSEFKHKLHNYLGSHFNYTLSGLILDMRDNPGGNVKESVCIASLFLPRETPILIETTKGSRKETIVSIGGGSDLLKTVPMITLIDSQTASAAEIVAAALQDNHRARLIGTRTYGKGTQQWVQTGGPISLVHHNTAKRSLRPGRDGNPKPIEQIGVFPDIVAHLTPDPSLGELINAAITHPRREDLFYAYVSKKNLYEEARLLQKERSTFNAETIRWIEEQNLAAHFRAAELDSDNNDATDDATDYPLFLSKALLLR